MAELVANSGDPDQTPHSAASDLGQHCLPVTLLQVYRLQWVKKTSPWLYPTVPYLITLNIWTPQFFQHLPHTLWADSADDKLMIYFLFFLENRDLTLHAIHLLRR